MPATVVILTKLPGRLPVKTRLVPALGVAGAEAFYRESLARTIALARAFTPRVRVAYSPPDAPPPGPEYVPVAGADGAACLENALADAFDGGILLALGGDAPDLPPARLAEAERALEGHDAVLVPSGDGGFSCLGLRRPVAGLGAAFPYGGDDACDALERFLRAQGLRVAVLAPWPDVDTPEDLRALAERGNR